MPNINEMLLKLECFRYAMSIYLNMGYYYIQLSEYSRNLCFFSLFILPWGKYCYKCLPKGVNSLEIFQNKMNGLFQEFGFIRLYVYELLI